MPNHYGERGCNCGTAVHSVVPSVQHRGAGGEWAGAEGRQTNRSLLFSSPHSMALRVMFMNIHLQVILCSSLKMQSLMDFYGPNLIPLSERQKSHHHRDSTLPTDLFYYYVGKGFGGTGGSSKDFKEISQQKKKELKKPKQPINPFPKAVKYPLRSRHRAYFPAWTQGLGCGVRDTNLLFQGLTQNSGVHSPLGHNFLMY